jgi:hypothetical protein
VRVQCGQEKYLAVHVLQREQHGGDVESRARLGEGDAVGQVREELAAQQWLRQHIVLARIAECLHQVHHERRVQLHQHHHLRRVRNNRNVCISAFNHMMPCEQPRFLMVVRDEKACVRPKAKFPRVLGDVDVRLTSSSSSTSTTSCAGTRGTGK